MVRSLVVIKPLTRPVQNNNYKEPHGVYNPKIKTEMHRAKQERQIGVDNIFCTITRRKKENNTEQMYQVKMYDIVKERHPAIDHEGTRELIAGIFQQ